MTITPSDSLDALIARGPPDATDFAKQIAGLPGAYYAGLDEAYKRRTQDAFQNLDPSKPIDLNALYKTALINQGTSAAIPIASGLQEQAKQEALGEVARRAFPDTNALPPATGSPSIQPPAPAPPVTPQQPGTIAGQPVTPSISSLYPSGYGDQEKRRLGLAIAQELNIPSADLENQPLTPQQIAQAQPIIDRFQAARAARPAPTPPAVPPTLSSVQDPAVASQRAALEQRRNALQQVGARAEALQKGAGKPYLDAAAEIDKQLQPTTGQKESIADKLPGETEVEYAARKEDAKTRAVEGAKFYTKKYETIQAAGEKANTARGSLDAAEQIMAQPSFYSGPLGDKVLLIKQAAAALGIDPDAAASPEAFRSLANRTVFETLGGLGNQISDGDRKFITGAFPNLGNTPQGNKVLVEILRRTNDRALKIADMAQNYNNGRLDAGFDRQVTQYAKAHPLFSNDEQGRIQSLPKAKVTVTPQENATAINPTTKERLIYRNGKWGPM